MMHRALPSAIKRPPVTYQAPECRILVGNVAGPVESGSAAPGSSSAPGRRPAPSLLAGRTTVLVVFYVGEQRPTDHVGHGLAAFRCLLLGSLPELVVNANSADLRLGHSAIVPV